MLLIIPTAYYSFIQIGKIQNVNTFVQKRTLEEQNQKLHILEPSADITDRDNDAES